MVDPDGVLRVVIAHEDPGITNWLDTAGHSEGPVILRCVRTENAPVPQTRVVKFADVAGALPNSARNALIAAISFRSAATSSFDAALPVPHAVMTAIAPPARSHVEVRRANRRRDMRASPARNAVRHSLARVRCAPPNRSLPSSVR